MANESSEPNGSDEPLKVASPIGETRRSAVHSGPIALVERFSVMSNGRSPVGHSPDYQVVLPCAGVFQFGVGRRVHFLDVNRTLFVSAGEDYWEEHPIRDLGHSSIIITPSAEVLDELCGRGGPAGHACFKDASRLTNIRARLAAHRLVGSAGNGSQLQRDELAVEALRAALEPRDQPGRRAPSRAVDRARQLMHERECQRMSLTEIAGVVGVTPAHLTQAFSRMLGMPLYKYQLRLRLGGALAELPHCEDITALAFELGFSSHSHFSAAFRSVFGMTPSEVRAMGARPGRAGKAPEIKSER